MSQPVQNQDKNIVVGTDYSQLAKLHTNGAILDSVSSMLFSKSMGYKSFLVMLRNVAILIVVKMILEDFKSILDKFRFTDLYFIKYIYQKFRFGEIGYSIDNVHDKNGNKWFNKDEIISINTLTTMMESRTVLLSKPGTYYYEHFGYIVKVIVTGVKITFAVPNISQLRNHIETDVLYKNTEFTFGQKTTITKITVKSDDIVKTDPVSITHAYPTENYIRLEKMIHYHFVADGIIKFPSIPVCISFDGIPGTGKTTFASYIAPSGIFDKIYICNMVQLSKMDFKEVIGNIERKLITPSNIKDEKILMIFDEIDKWLSSYIENQMSTMREQARKKVQVLEDKSSDSKKGPTVLENYEKLTIDEEDERRLQIRNNFLDQLYNLLEGNMLINTKKYVLIFNTNEFSQIFKDTPKKYNALRDRFQQFHFSEIGKTDIIKYLKNINNTFINSLNTNVDCDKIVKELIVDKDDIYDLIPEDYTISYRKLQKILRFSNFSISKTIDNIVNNVVIDQNLSTELEKIENVKD